MENTEKQQEMLPKYFFRDNIIDELSAEMLTFFSAKVCATSEGKALMDNMLDEMFDLERQNLINEEQQYIENLSDPQDILRYMRKLKDPYNKNVLVNKVLENQEKVVPLIISKLRTSGYNIFIELAAAVLLLADEKYLKLLQERFEEIRNPYARAEACLAFAREGKTEYTKFLLEQYNLFKKDYKEKSFYNGPLIALSIIYKD